MFKLICYERGHSLKHEFTAITLEEILSASVCAFNQNYSLSEIQKNDIKLYSSCEIYNLIQKAVY
jgi:hypothetical protein